MNWLGRVHRGHALWDQQTGTLGPPTPSRVAAMPTTVIAGISRGAIRIGWQPDTRILPVLDIGREAPVRLCDILHQKRTGGFRPDYTMRNHR